MSKFADVGIAEARCQSHSDVSYILECILRINNKLKINVYNQEAKYIVTTRQFVKYTDLAYGPLYLMAINSFVLNSNTIYCVTFFANCIESTL
jgi:hypothetical protein